MPRLRVVHSKVAALIGREYDIAAGSVTLGRAPENQIVVDDDGMSRVHARMTTTAAGVEVSDNGSANGLWVDGQRVPSVVLRPGLLVTIGNTSFELLEGDNKATVLLGHNVAAYPELAAAQAQRQQPPPPMMTPPPQMAPAPPPPATKRGWVLPATLIGVVVVGGATAIAVVATRKDEKSSSPSPSPSPTPTPSTIPSTIPSTSTTTTTIPGAPVPATFQASPAGTDYSVTQPGSPIDRIHVSVPPGAIDAPVDIQITWREPPPGDPTDTFEQHPELLTAVEAEIEARNAIPGGGRVHPIWGPMQLLGAPRTRLLPDIVLEPAGTTFKKPVRIDLPLPASLPADATSGDLLVVHEAGGRLEVAHNVTLDRAGQRIQLEVGHFSSFGTFFVNAIKYPFRRTSMWWDDRVDSDTAKLPADIPGRFTRTLLCEGGTWTATPSTMPTLWSTLMYLGFEGSRLSSKSAETKMSTWMTDVFERRRKGEQVDAITVEALYARALRETNNDVFMALVAAHNVLRDNRDRPTVQGAMAPFRGDGGDERGARYHLFGAAIYSYVHAYQTANGGYTDVMRRLLRPQLTIEAEEGVVSGDIESDSMEFAVDLQGMKMGKQLFEQAQKSRGQLVQETGFQSRDCPESLATKATKKPPATPTKPPPSGGSAKAYGVFKAGDTCLVGEKTEIENTRTCDIRGWGVDCSKVVKDAVPDMSFLAGPFPTSAKAVAAYCKLLDKTSFRNLNFAAGTVAKVGGQELHVEECPSCP
ncbi:MAG TPA: FHA domain-containing protein [Kofleriaceae bacterium]|nr:FHA domain-containing protein [Kofleriaceae bacterium]